MEEEVQSMRKSKCEENSISLALGLKGVTWQGHYTKVRVTQGSFLNSLPLGAESNPWPIASKKWGP